MLFEYVIQCVKCRDQSFALLELANVAAAEVRTAESRSFTLVAIVGRLVSCITYMVADMSY